MQNPRSTETRRRDPDLTRAAILDAARLVFSTHGFDGAGTREIARQAGCNIALINRYFGSKAGLFREVMEHCVDLQNLFTVSRADLPSALADITLSKKKDASEFDPMFAAIRSTSSVQAREIVKEEMGNPMVEILADHLGGKNAHVRAALVLSIIAGFDVSRHLIGPDALSPQNDEQIRPILEASFRAALSEI